MALRALRPGRLICAGALATLFGAVPFAQAGWQISSSDRRESSPVELVEHWVVALENTERAEAATLHLAVFSTHRATLRVIDQPDAPRRELAEVMAETKSLAGVNGGYFDPEDAPVGLLISAGHVIAPQRKAKLLSGVLAVSPTRIDIVRATHFVRSEKISAALQCGPLLVERAAPVAGLNDTRRARRTFAAIDGKGGAAVGVSSSVSLAQLGQILSRAHLGGKLKIVRALNFDGGSSTAFWFAGNNEAFSIREAKPVRDFVAVVPR